MGISAGNVEKLQRLVERIDGLKQFDGFSVEFKSWWYDVERVLRHSPIPPNYLEVFRRLDFGHYEAIGPTHIKQRNAKYSADLDEARLLIEAIIKESQEYDVGENSEKPDVRAEPAKVEAAAKKPCVFIGHGRSPLWARVQLFLEKEFGLSVVNYESETRAGETIVAILEQMLNEASFAILILTAEDETESGTKRARQNVVHEAGLFQGRLGFNKAILLVQEGLEEFSNVAGLQNIPFTGGRINQTFDEVRRVLKREGLIA